MVAIHIMFSNCEVLYKPSIVALLCSLTMCSKRTTSFPNVHLIAIFTWDFVNHIRDALILDSWHIMNHELQAKIHIQAFGTVHIGLHIGLTAIIACVDTGYGGGYTKNSEVYRVLFPC